MTRTRPLLLVCVLLVLAGCLGGVGESPSSPTSSATPPATPTPTPTPTPTSTATISADDAGERAIEAEQSRIERRLSEYEAVGGLGFGILRPAESEVVERNESGVVVRVSVGYSLELDCDGDGTPDESLDGTSTETTYVVSESGVRLTGVSRDVLDPSGYC
ncbi:hypothetical protein SAMN04487947_2478 [Halogeometricum rufum]|uniref:Uncharacterized protein n=1 Tax=Halogeometricum rufum TaxID=553469 RepID=A0A1I6HTG3_9EURY|nr:hypothetical protein [Halogeometricum rufum]SFR57735.1 hypothetical protein SAMN04487947_2478 [Halogeometricum rufum]